MKRRKRKARGSLWQRKSSRSEIKTRLSQAEAQISQQRPDQALETLEQVPERARNDPEYRYLRGLCFLMMGNTGKGIDDLEIAVRREPPGSPRYLQLAMAYMDSAWPRHAWKYAEMYLRDPGFDPQMTQSARLISQEAQAFLAGQAQTLGFSVEDLAKAALYNETAQRHLRYGRFRESIRACDSSIRLLKNWAAPRNNKALATFLSGNVNYAIRVERQVLAEIDAENVQALGNLILFHFSVLDDDAVTPYANRLRQLSHDSDFENFDLDKAIEAFALLAEEDALWEIAEAMAQEEMDRLNGSSWYVLGAAAANRGRVRLARKFFEYAQTLRAYPSQWVEEGIRCLEQTGRRRQAVRGFSLQGRFPYAHYTRLFTSAIIADALEGPASDADEDKSIGRISRKYPFIIGGYRLILWHETEETARAMALAGLSTSDNEAAHKELLRFGQSQVGTLQQRLEALRALQEHGRLPDEANTLRMWNEERGEWFEGSVFMQRIGDPDEPPCNDQAMHWQAQAIELTRNEDAGEAERRQAIAYLEKAVAADGDCAPAVHNLGINYIHLGEKEKGEALIRQSLEMNPDYLFGYCTLAGLAFQRGEYDEAKELLTKVATAPTIETEVYERMSDIQFRIAAIEEDYEAAGKILDMQEEIGLDLDDIAAKRSQLRLLELNKNMGAYWLKDTHNYRKRQLNKPISAKATLSTCLQRISRERLKGTLRAWHLKTSGRKSEIIDRLCLTMLDPAALARFVQKRLAEEERRALSVLLEQDGVMPRQAFIEQFDDDFDESPYWHYHEAKTTTGRLQMFGLVATGTLKKEWVMLIPADLRPLLNDAL